MIAKTDLYQIRINLFKFFRIRNDYLYRTEKNRYHSMDGEPFSTKLQQGIGCHVKVGDVRVGQKGIGQGIGTLGMEHPPTKKDMACTLEAPAM